MELQAKILRPTNLDNQYAIPQLRPSTSFYPNLSDNLGIEPTYVNMKRPKSVAFNLIDDSKPKE